MNTVSHQLSLNFRKDINGLRAYAVIAVLLYHFGAAGMTGGYAGVDIFFVISGFLMTAIILPKVESGRFSLSAFYLARIRRILPALAVLCSAMLLFGWFWLAPFLYENLGKSAGASLLFISNFVYNRGGGYFAPHAHDNWLLHTWSLSVEWQFYLLYPLLLLAMARFSGGSRHTIRILLIFVLLVSFAYAVYLTSAKPTSAFFLLPSRAWELLAGSLVFLYSGQFISDKFKRTIEAAGLALIVIAFFSNDSGTPWPGYSAALPVAGACLMLMSARQNSLWTGNWIAQSLGRWSYSIYLWHWPLVVGLGYFGVRGESHWLMAAMAASLVLGALSYHLVEQPSARWMRKLDRRTSWSIAGAGLGLAFTFSAIVYFDHGVARTLRLPAEVLAAAHEKENTGQLTKCNTAESQCMLGDGKTLAVVWGDSHAIAAVSGVAEAAKQVSGGILFFGQQACPVIFNARVSNTKSPHFCRDFNDMVFERLKQMDRTIPVIIINREPSTYIEAASGIRLFIDGPRPDNPAERWAVYEKNLVDSLCRIADRNPVYAVLPIPEMPYDVPAVLSRSLIITGKAPQPTTSMSAYREASQAVTTALLKAQQRCGIRLLDPAPYFCTQETCHGVVDGRPLYSDSHHLSENGALRLAPMYAEAFKPR